MSLRPHTLDDLMGDIVRVAEAIGRSDDGQRLVRRMRERLDHIAARVAGGGGASLRSSSGSIRRCRAGTGGGNHFYSGRG